MKATLDGLPITKAAAIQPEFEFGMFEGTLEEFGHRSFRVLSTSQWYHFHFLSEAARREVIFLCNAVGKNLRVRVDRLR